MATITKLLASFESDGVVSDALVDSIYQELRVIAQAQLSRERPDQTLQPTALVHEAYQRLFHDGQHYDNRRHFFCAAALVMRRILVDRARRRLARIRGGEMSKHRLTEFPEIAHPGTPQEILDLHDALTLLEEGHPRVGELVQLRFFAGLTIREAADVMGVSVRSANRTWKFARSWLHRAISGEDN